MHSTLDPNQLHLSVDGLILTVVEGQLTLLLSRRTAAPYEGCWALPGRLIGLEETAEDAVHSLLDEMLPDTRVYIEQLYTFTAPDRDPRGRIASIAYLVLLPWERLQAALSRPDVPLRCFRVLPEGKGVVFAGSDGTILPPEALAFDHGAIAQTGVTRLQGKIDYTEVGFHLLRDSDAFSLSELQTIFEAVLNTAVDASNFRRSILNKYEAAGRICQTDKARKQGRGRPATLYRYTP